MLHEVVITLLGKSGPLLRSLDSYVDLKTFLHPHEIQLLKEVLVIAKDFKQLQDFIEANRFNIQKIPDSNKNNVCVDPGLYIQAFSEALDQVLDAYRQEIISLEQRVMSDCTTTLLYISSRVDQYRCILSTLCGFVANICTKTIRGCKILQLLHDESVTATDEVKSSIDCILQRCHRVLMKQISNWLLNGYMIDPFNEFFITKTKSEQSELLSICADITSETDFQHRHKELKYEEYTLVAEYIPTYIPYSLVNDMLFTGRIVLTLNKNREFKYALVDGLNKFVFKNREMELYRNFESLLKTQSFDVTALEKLVLEIKSYVVEYLWQVAVEEHHLFDELRLIKNFYLLGQADIFIDLLKNFNVFIKARSSKYFIKNINAYLRESDYVTQSIDEATLEKFNFCLTPLTNTGEDSNKSSKSKRDDPWSSIILEYKTSWSLNLLFTKDIMLRYNKVLMFLLRIRKCHLSIHQIWFKEVKNKTTEKFELSWKLRNELMFLISNLQFYLQVDVIEAEYGSLIELLRNQTDFQQVIRLHNMFLLNILSQSFISSTEQSVEGDEFNQSVSSIKPHKIYLILNQIFELCEKFCAIMIKDNMDESQKMKDYQTMMNALSLLRSALLNALLALQFQPYRGNLSKLLLRLDMNGWFTKSSVIPLNIR